MNIALGLGALLVVALLAYLLRTHGETPRAPSGTQRSPAPDVPMVAGPLAFAVPPQPRRAALRVGVFGEVGRKAFFERTTSACAVESMGDGVLRAVDDAIEWWTADCSRASVVSSLASMMDVAILTEDTIYGPTPIARECMQLFAMSGVPVVVVITGCGPRVDHELLELIDMENRELAEMYGIRGDAIQLAYDAADTPVVHVPYAAKGGGEAIRALLLQHVPRTPITSEVTSSVACAVTAYPGIQISPFNKDTAGIAPGVVYVVLNGALVAAQLDLEPRIAAGSSGVPAHLRFENPVEIHSGMRMPVLRRDHVLGMIRL